jgi:cell division initiation protein
MANGIRVTPIDIQQKRFHTAFRGLDRTEVEMFLDLVRDEMEALIHEVTELREFRQAFDQKTAELNDKEEMVKKTLLMAQKIMDDQKDNARREAALIIKDAELRRNQITGNAQEEKAKLETELRDLRRSKIRFLQDIRKVIQMHQEIVDFEEPGELEEASAER